MDNKNPVPGAEFTGLSYVEDLSFYLHNDMEKITPDYDKKHIRSTIEFLYNSGAQENAKKICNIYGSRGHEFLRDIYEKHTNST